VSTGFWIKRFLVVLVAAFMILFAAQLLRGNDASQAVIHAALWGSISTTVFIATRWWRARRGQHCALCRDTPAMR
jgi:hypothetical protein